jgi:hypothetical protein
LPLAWSAQHRLGVAGAKVLISEASGSRSEAVLRDRALVTACSPAATSRPRPPPTGPTSPRRRSSGCERAGRAVRGAGRARSACDARGEPVAREARRSADQPPDRARRPLRAHRRPRAERLGSAAARARPRDVSMQPSCVRSTRRSRSSSASDGHARADARRGTSSLGAVPEKSSQVRCEDDAARLPWVTRGQLPSAAMPRVSAFYGIVITMYWRDHPRRTFTPPTQATSARSM